MERLHAAVLAAIVCLSGGSVRVLADGMLPPGPYRYLHPPPSLAATNQQPLPGIRVVPADYMHAAVWSAFTVDGQAGVDFPRAAFRTAGGATGVVVRIRPVETPPGLPDNLAPIGNAYEFSGAGDPAGSAALVRPARLLLRWPSLPSDLYILGPRGWSRLCSLSQAVVSPTTIACRTHTLGVVVEVRRGASRRAPSQVPRIIPLGVAVVLVALYSVLLGRRLRR